jgi:Zn finger protein HypA/HybF involved in hydrogenase expression
MSHSDLKLPSSGTLCWCRKCGDLFRSWPNQDYCEKHRKPRIRLVNGKWVTV